VAKLECGKEAPEGGIDADALVAWLKACLARISRAPRAAGGFAGS